MKTSLILLFWGLCGSCIATSLEYYCLYASGKIELCESGAKFDSKLWVYAEYVHTIPENGWNQLELVTNPELSDEAQAYYAGFAEGFITRDLIALHHYNLLADQEERCKSVKAFMSDNNEFVMTQVKQNPNDPYWHELSLVYYQLAGMDDGYRGRACDTPHNHVDPCGLFLMNLQAEFGELDKMLNVTTEKVEPEDHCSAIIKILPDNEDVLTSHNTWGNPRNMLRIFKRYNLNLKTSQAKSVAMSSYPGVIFSFDDYYITSQKLVILETTNTFHGKWPQISAHEIVFEFVRNIIANRLASNGEEWSKAFMKYNSGTYNNQFMVVDYKLFLNQKIQPGFLTILEQFPGRVVHADKTQALLDRGYWSSYNVPYYRSMYRYGGYEEMRTKYGDHYDHDNTARALIFDRDHTTVTNMSTLFHLMRYNNFRVDPLSRCDCTPPYTADNVIASRNDLNDPNGTYPFSDYAFRSSLAYDAKMTSAKLVEHLVSVAVSGPTDQNVEPFDWRTTKIQGLRHKGHPDRWTFKPIITIWNQTFPYFNFDF